MMLFVPFGSVVRRRFFSPFLPLLQSPFQSILLCFADICSCCLVFALMKIFKHIDCILRTLCMPPRCGTKSALNPNGAVDSARADKSASTANLFTFRPTVVILKTKPPQILRDVYRQSSPSHRRRSLPVLFALLRVSGLTVSVQGRGACFVFAHVNP